LTRGRLRVSPTSRVMSRQPAMFDGPESLAAVRVAQPDQRRPLAGDGAFPSPTAAPLGSAAWKCPSCQDDESLVVRRAPRRARRRDSLRFQQPNLAEAVHDAVGEMCPHPAPAIDPLATSWCRSRAFVKALEMSAFTCIWPALRSRACSLRSE
jgi:hypothetical protein